MVMVVNNCLQEEMHCKNLGSNKKQMFGHERQECKRAYHAKDG